MLSYLFNSKALQLLSETQNKNEKTMKRLMKFFNTTDNNDPDYEPSTLDGLDRETGNLEDSELVGNNLDEGNSEYFEPPRRRKGRPRKLKALPENEETIPIGSIIKFSLSP